MAGIGRFQHTGAAPQTNLAFSMGAADTSFTTASGVGYPDGSVGDFVVAVDPGLPSEEHILCSARSGAVFTVVTRGYDNTSASAHTAPTALVEHIVAATEIDDASRHINPTALVYSDDHVNYALVNGARPFTGAVSGSFPFTGTAMGATGLTGAANNTRLAGSTTAGGPPSSGTFVAGDLVPDQKYGMLWICITGGSPGTWIGAGTGQLMARAYLVGTPTLSGSPLTIAFNNTTYDPLSMVNTGTGVFTVPVAGRWQVYAQVNVTVTSGTQLEVIIRQNATDPTLTYMHGSASLGLSGVTHDTLVCAANDTIQIQAVVNTGTPSVVSGSINTFAWIARVGG